MEVTLMEMLEARERRAGRQRELLERFGKPMISFTMNIAGPVKNGPEIARGFDLGKELLHRQLMTRRAGPVYTEEIREKTGNEALYVLDLEPMAAKELTVALEDGATLGRLFDMDVLRPDGSKVDRGELGLEPRRCLICGGPAQVCARSRAHTVAQLQARTAELLEEALSEYDGGTAARLACQALLYEVCTTPKPGLVDRDNSGSHRDMDIFTFQASAAALWPYFARCFRIGRETRREPPTMTLARLRAPGRLAEGDMLRATGGVNTHKGAIFSMGLLCGALGRLERARWKRPREVLAECAAMARGLVERDFGGLTPETARTAGERLYARYGISGVRGEAQAGFPAVLTGLGKLEAGLARGLSLNDAGCAALLAMLAANPDTNVIARSSLETQKKIARETAALLEKDPFPGEAVLKDLDRAFTAENISPGGTADLLALVYLLWFLKQEAY